MFVVLPAVLAVVPAQSPPMRLAASQEFTYAQRGSTALKLDLYRLPDPVAGKRPRLFVLIHGGGWVSGTKAELRPHALRLRELGFAVASVDYRLAPNHLWPAQRTDVRDAVRWLRSQAKRFGYDASFVVAGGESAGGHLSMWLGLDREVQAIVSISGLHDLRIPMSTEGESYRIVQRALGDAYPAKLREFSPLPQITRRFVPTYFIHGKRDPWVPVVHSEVAHRQLQKLGGVSKLELVGTMGHGLKPANPPERAALDRAAKWALALRAR
ncbi:MAG: alpha/beta hydrolase [Fimbriimonadaceae bacterium]|nr:alpha/beta hydrolase [Fimbriimonadaceae bacterium]